MIRVLLAALLLAGPSQAQTIDPPIFQGETFTLTPELDTEILNELDENGDPIQGDALDGIEDVQQDQVAQGGGAMLRMLDKLSGSVTDLEFTVGEQRKVDRLTVRLNECRYPKDNPSGDAYGHLVIWPQEDQRPVFDGWMVASSPALNAMDHPRYDVWLLRCKTS